MKMLFYSSDTSEVELARGQFATAGIPCVVRSTPALAGATPPEPCSELWIERDKDRHRASMLCVQLGIGFSRRHPSYGPADIETEDEAGENSPSESRASVD